MLEEGVIHEPVRPEDDVLTRESQVPTKNLRSYGRC